MTSDRDFAEAESLWEFVTDRDKPPTTDLERTVRRVQRATANSTPETTVPRDAVWSQVMANAAARPAAPSRTATGFIASRGWARQQVGRWQSVVSFGLVLAFLASLLIVAHDRVISPALATATPTASGHAGMVPLDATPGLDGECVAREVTWQEPDVPPVRTPVPQYEAKQPAPREIGEAALETYLGFYACFSANPFDSPEIQTYLSGNMQPAEDSEVLLGNWAPPGGSDVGATSGTNSDRLVEEVVIPLNGPLAAYVFPDEGASNAGEFVVVFWPEDVQELIDGRYGVVIGSVSTETFRDGTSRDDPVRDGRLLWVSFVEQDGQLFIDEYHPFCIGEWVLVDGEGNQLATPVTHESITAAQFACR